MKAGVFSSTDERENNFNKMHRRASSLKNGTVQIEKRHHVYGAATGICFRTFTHSSPAPTLLVRPTALRSRTVYDLDRIGVEHKSEHIITSNANRAEGL